MTEAGGALIAKLDGSRAEDSLNTAFDTVLKSKDFGEQASEQTVGLVRWRMWIGYALGSLAIAAFGWLFYSALGDVAEFINRVDLDFQTKVLGLGSHGVVTLAAAYFLYQLLRLAERMVIPWWWFRENPDAAKALMGITEPAKAVEATLARIVQLLGK